MRARSKRLVVSALLLAAAGALPSCAVPLNFNHPGGPRWAGRPVASVPVSGAPYGARDSTGAAGSTLPAAPAELRVVTFNIKYSREITRATELLRAAPELRAADVIFLQEMDQNGARRVATALGMGFVYYPATVHPMTGRCFGNAILSRWPMTDDRKIILPYLGRFGHTQRIAVGATIAARGVPIRVYNVHVATGVEVAEAHRREQVLAVLADADAHPGCVIVGGDLNAKGLGTIFVQHGYEWPTRDLGFTSRLGATDHIFLRGLRLGSLGSVGKVRDNLQASDHLPVWAVVALPDPPAAGPPIARRPARTERRAR